MVLASAAVTAAVIEVIVADALPLDAACVGWGWGKEGGREGADSEEERAAEWEGEKGIRVSGEMGAGEKAWACIRCVTHTGNLGLNRPGRDLPR
jgi:hypothetical protein